MIPGQTRKKLFPISFLPAAAGTLLFAVLWLNNLVYALHYHVKLLADSEAAAKIPNGLLPKLNWTAIDVSTITTLIPFFGFLLLMIGVCRIRNTEQWPFFPGYDRLNIALGLLGTLWGIILIGYYPADQVTIPALMSCLHTAMFSTLAAIVWVMVLEPLLFRPWMNSLRRASFGKTEEEPSLDELTNTLLEGLDKTGRELKQSGDAAAKFREELAKLNADLAENRKTEQQWRQQTMECLRAMTAAAEDFKAQQERLSGENRELRERGAKLEQDLAASVEEAARLKRQLDAIREALR